MPSPGITASSKSARSSVRPSAVSWSRISDLHRFTLSTRSPRFYFFLLVLPIARAPQKRNNIDPSRWRSFAAGVKFVFSRKVILATITLDLFAVLLGGAVALLPIFADQILHCGPVGLGWMRAAPAVGAFSMALLVAYLPPMRQAGKTLLWCVVGF